MITYIMGNEGVGKEATARALEAYEEPFATTTIVDLRHHWPNNQKACQEHINEATAQYSLGHLIFVGYPNMELDLTKFDRIIKMIKFKG